MISDFDTAEIMLRYFIKKIYGERRAIQLSAPNSSSVCPAALQRWKSARWKAQHGLSGVRDVILFEEPLAAAMGAGLPISEARGSMIVDLGGGTTEIAVISLNGIVVCKSLKCGRKPSGRSDHCSMSKKQYNIVLIGEMTAEQVKIGLGSAYECEPERKNADHEAETRKAACLPKSLCSAAEIKDAIVRSHRKNCGCS